MMSPADTTWMGVTKSVEDLWQQFGLESIPNMRRRTSDTVLMIPRPQRSMFHASINRRGSSEVPFGVMRDCTKLHSRFHLVRI